CCDVISGVFVLICILVLPAVALFAALSGFLLVQHQAALQKNFAPRSPLNTGNEQGSRSSKLVVDAVTHEGT
ncbi:unnamed protein product, partial [Amoebophrya sp. A25]